MPTLSGTTLDAAGVPLAGATVKVFRSSDDTLVATGTSDGAGTYAITTPDAGPFYALSRREGNPFVTGVTAPDLVAGAGALISEAPAYKSAGTVGATTAATSVAVPLGTNSADDILFVEAICRGSTEPLTMPAGWAEVTPQINVGGNQLAWFWKRSTGAEAAPTLANAGRTSTNLLSGQMVVYSGCRAAGLPFENVVTASSTSGPMVGAAVTGAGLKRRAVTLWIRGTNSAAGPTVGWTENLDQGTSGGGGCRYFADSAVLDYDGTIPASSRGGTTELFGAVGFALIGVGEDQQAEPKTFTRGLWVWDSANFLASNNEQNILLNEAKASVITDVYLYVPRISYAVSSSALRGFVAKATSIGVRVWGMDGYRGWFSDAEGPAELFDTATALVTYNAASAANERFVGLHIDMEPADLDGFPTSFHNGIASSALSTTTGGVWQATQALDREMLMRDWVAIHEELHARMSAAGLDLGTAIPTWADDYFGEPIVCTYGGVTKNIVEHLSDHADDLVLMNYNTSDINQIDRMRFEILASNARLSTAVETHAGVGTGISYADTAGKATKSAVLNDLATIRARYAGYPRFKGDAIHDWEGWKALSPASTDISDPVTGIIAATLQSIWTGIPSPEGVIITSKLNSSGAGQSCRVLVYTDAGFTNLVAASPLVTPDPTYRIAKHTVMGLAPDSIYRYCMEIDGVRDTATTGRFKTTVDGEQYFEVAFGSCAESSSDHPIFDDIRTSGPNLFLHLGDIHYADSNSTSEATRMSLFDTVFTRARQHRLYRDIPTAYTWDDHDYCGNDSNAAAAGRAAAVGAFRKRVPAPFFEGASDGAVYYSFKVGRVIFIMTDLRSRRSGTDFMGATQLAWFKSIFTNNPGAYFVWCSAVPVVSSTGGDTWSGASAQRTEIWNHIRDSGATGRVMILAGDMHASAYHAGANYCTGTACPIPVFHSSPFDRPASQKGGAYTAGPIPASGTAQTNQYGYLIFDDLGASGIDVTWTTYNAVGDEVHSHNFLMLGTPPAAPVLNNAVTNLTPDSVTTSSVLLSWTAPTTGDAPTDYIVQQSPAGAATWSTFADGVSSGNSAEVTGLTAGTAYDFRVAPINAAGTGPYATIANVSTASAGGTMPTSDFTGSAVNVEQLNSYTFTAHPVGEAHAERLLAIGILWNSTGSSPGTSSADLASVTVNGAAATNIRTQASTSSRVTLYYIPLPEGTTADIVVNLLGLGDRCAIGTWAIYNPLTDAPTAHNGANAATTTLTAPANSFTIGMSSVNNATATSTWQGLEEDFRYNMESAQTAGGASLFSAAGASLTIGAGWSSTSSLRTAAATWQLG